MAKSYKDPKICIALDAGEEGKGLQGRSSHLDGAGDVRLLPAKDYLSRNCNPVEEVVDEAHVVDECVHVTGDQHQQRGETLGRRE